MAELSDSGVHSPHLRTASSLKSLWTQLRKRWHRLRNRLLVNPDFQDRAMRLPFGRSIGRSRALAMHHITAGFVYSQTLAACVELGLFEKLRYGALSTRALSSASQLPEAGLKRLLLAAASLRLIENYGDDSWGLGDLGAAMLANPGVGAMVHHHQHLYRDLLDPVELLRERKSTHLSRYWPYALDEHQLGGHDEYSNLMALSQQMIAGHVLNAARLDHKVHLVDIAGGYGAFARKVLQRLPEARVTVLDLPQVAERANAENTESRLTFVGGDMFNAELPVDCDVVSVVRILHDHDDEPVRTLLARMHDAMRPDARLLIAEPMAGTRGAESIGDAYFGLYLWAMGSGRPRTFEELSGMLSDAGFVRIREKPSDMPCLVRVIEATPNKT